MQDSWRSDSNYRRILRKRLIDGDGKMIEKEYKFLLTKEQYIDLKKYFEWDKSFEQFNHYYNDIDNYIYDNDITVRIREKNGEFRLQTKTNMFNNGALAIKEEKELVVDNAFEEIQPQILEDMIGNLCRGIHKVGVLKTYRNVCTKFQNIEICLDMNEYLSVIDYELELEYASENGEHMLVQQIVENFGLSLEKKSAGKNHRFFLELNRLS